MKVAIYARVSTKDKGQSNENQLSDLRSIAAALSYSIDMEQAEKEGITGERSQFKALFADAHQWRFDSVLFWSLDRFSREGALPTLQVAQGVKMGHPPRAPSRLSRCAGSRGRGRATMPLYWACRLASAQSGELVTLIF